MSDNSNSNHKIEIDQHDRGTVERLAAAGVNPALVARVERMAKDAAYWKGEAAFWRKAVNRAWPDGS